MFLFKCAQTVVSLKENQLPGHAKFYYEFYHQIRSKIKLLPQLSKIRVIRTKVISVHKQKGRTEICHTRLHRNNNDGQRSTWTCHWTWRNEKEDRTPGPHSGLISSRTFAQGLWGGIHKIQNTLITWPVKWSLAHCRGLTAAVALKSFKIMSCFTELEGGEGPRRAPLTVNGKEGRGPSP